MNLSEYFYQNWLDKLVTLISVIVGIVTSAGIIMSKVGELIKGFKQNTEKVIEEGKKLKETADVQKTLNEKLDTLSEETNELINECKAIIQADDQNRRAFDCELKKIEKSLYIAFVNSQELVKKGKATTIAEIIGDEDENQVE